MQTTVASTPHVRWRGLTITIASLLAIGFATLLPEPGQPPGQHFCLVCGSVGGVDAVLNVLLFVPLGIGLALAGLARKRALLTMFALSALIEAAQLLLIPGRDSTLGDVVTNTIGGALGFALARYTWHLVRPSARMATILTVGWGAAWLAIQSISNYGFAPSLPQSRYYGQIARAIGNFAVFDGSVITASAGDIAIPNSAIPDSHALRRALLDGAPMVTTVANTRPSRGIAPIVRVADGEQREIVLLAQRGEDFVFSMRSGAAVLRLRRPLFALPNAFPAGAASRSPPAKDTLSLSGTYLAREVSMSAQTTSTTRRSQIPLAASLAWTLVLPFDWLIQGTRAESVMSWVWTALLLVPFGYWAARTSHSATGNRVATASLLPLLGALPLLALGFAVIPHRFGLPAASPADLLSALTGVVLGCGLAFRMGRQ